MSDGGKGSAQRPIANRKTFEENWDAIFGAGDGNSNVPDSVLRGGADRDSERQSTDNEGGATHQPSE